LTKWLVLRTIQSQQLLQIVNLSPEREQQIMGQQHMGGMGMVRQVFAPQQQMMTRMHVAKP
jgi:hypothetical protein